MIAVLLLCGAATIALIATNARAEQSGHKPMMIALVAPGRTTAAPPVEGGSPPPRRAMRESGLGREQICRDVYAGKAGELAFLEAKLSLDAKQAPLFARWKQASLDIAKQNEGDCAGRPPRRDLRAHRPNAVDRMTLEEDLLKKRLADIQAERPVLTAFYNALTPAQKEEFSRSDTHRMPGRFNVMFGMLDHPHPGMGMMRQGPMNGPQGGPMGGPPEPPPLAR
jgi:Spy/CpxP family protein refolding chaperone